MIMNFTKKSKISLCCVKCNESVDIPDDYNLEMETAIFSGKHPNCTLEAFLNGKSLGIFSKVNTLKNKKWLN